MNEVYSGPARLPEENILHENAQQVGGDEPPPRFSVQRWTAVRECLVRSTVPVGGGRSPLSFGMKIAVLIVIALVGVIAMDRAIVHWRLRPYWSRNCMGRQWRHRFPQASKDEIRKFLSLLVGSFGIRHSRRLCFSPDDHVLAVHQSLGTFVAPADVLDMEAFIDALQRTYAVDVVPHWHEGITLGEVFSFTRLANAEATAQPNCDQPL